MSGRPHSVCFMDRKRCKASDCPIVEAERDEQGFLIFHDIRLKGWSCRLCESFNGEEKEIATKCNACEAPRPTS